MEIGNIVSILGIKLNTMGTLLTLWMIFRTRSSTVGTAGEYDSRRERFPKEKRLVILGFVIIVIGNLLQIIAVYWL